jgi:carbamoyltransferase
MNVLGLCSGTHDSAAALIRDGELIGLVKEERLNGEKHTKAYPAKSIEWLLNHAGITADDVTEIAYNFASAVYLRAVPDAARYLLRPATARRAIPRARSFAVVHRKAHGRVQDLQRRFPNATVRQITHHRAHGLYAFAASGYEEAAVLVVDSLGETVTATTARMRRTKHAVEDEPIQVIRDPASLGYAYGAVTEHLGWRRGDEEGTVMALAALGDPARFRDVFARAIHLTPDGFALDPRLLPLRVVSSRFPRVSNAFVAATCPPRIGEVEQVHADLAAALQERTEQVMLHLARRARRQTGCRLLCIGGGVAMNCVAVGRIAEEAGFAEVFVPPAPGDSGTAAGAALAAYLDQTGSRASGVADRCYLGPSYESLRLDLVPRPDLVARRVGRPGAFLAQRIANRAIVGLFQGRLEVGPRALGNRSILASPLDDDVVRRLNAEVKFREPFRPFAPVVLADKATDYFTLGQPSPYMSIASGVTELARKVIPSVVHVNGTARVQTVTRDRNPLLAEVLEEFEEITGVPVLINTSLNVKGKPICGTPDMALDCLAESGLDGLLIEDWWVTKR